MSTPDSGAERSEDRETEAASSMSSMSSISLDWPARSGKTESRPARRRKLIPLVLAVLVLGAAVAVGVLGWQAADASRVEAERNAALEAARAEVTQVLSYNSDTLDADLARSRKLLSGEFAAKFEDLASKVIIPASRAQRLSTKAEVVRAAVIDVQPNQVQTLIFVNQTTTMAGQPQPMRAVNQVKATMTRANDQWLISDLQPL